MRSVVVVDPRPVKGLVSSLIDSLENVLIKSNHDASKKPLFISGNFAPVKHETPPITNLRVIGHLPECLNGELFRVGPNPKFSPLAGYHWFDGDGMIHGLRIKNGKAAYVNRYVNTSRLKQEEFHGQAKYAKIGDLKGLLAVFVALIQFWRAKTKVLDSSYGIGTANTSLVYHDGKLLALYEGDKPYVVKIMDDGDLQTVGLLDYDKKLNHWFTAHPKVDPSTGEMFCFGTSFQPPYLTYRYISKDGCISNAVVVHTDKFPMMHDFAITENYAIFMDFPIFINPKEILKKQTFPLRFDEKKKSRFGILPRYAKDDQQIRWFELPSCYIFHTANAWEEDDDIVMIVIRFPTLDFKIFDSLSSEEAAFTAELYEMRFNLRTGSASQKRLSESALDFPRVNEKYIGRKQRFVYCSIYDDHARVTGIAKFDLESEPEIMAKSDTIEIGGNVRGIIDLGQNRYGSDFIFVPREPQMSSPSTEDDGYLMFYVHDENDGKSYVQVMDAKSMSGDAVAIVELPKRVPYGFHAYFVSEEQIANQIDTI